MSNKRLGFAVFRKEKQDNWNENLALHDKSLKMFFTQFQCNSLFSATGAWTNNLNRQKKDHISSYEKYQISSKGEGGTHQKAGT